MGVMDPIEIIPGLTVDTGLYEAAAAGLAAHAPDQPALAWEDFVAADRWWLVPSRDDDDAGVPLPYKAEYVVTTLASDLSSQPKGALLSVTAADRQQNRQPGPASEPRLAAAALVHRPGTRRVGR
jgi:hypothetical protein